MVVNRIMNSRFYLICIFLSSIAIAQNTIEIIGSVHSISSQNVYVKFDNTKGISINDTLFQYIGDKYTPALIVEHKSTAYLLTKILENINLSPGDKIVAIIFKNEIINIEYSILDSQKLEPIELESSVNKVHTQNIKQQIDGRISISIFNNYNGNLSNKKSTRFKQRFSITALNIADSKLSIINYKLHE